MADVASEDIGLGLDQSGCDVAATDAAIGLDSAVYALIVHGSADTALGVDATVDDLARVTADWAQGVESTLAATVIHTETADTAVGADSAAALAVVASSDTATGSDSVASATQSHTGDTAQGAEATAGWVTASSVDRGEGQETSAGTLTLYVTALDLAIGADEALETGAVVLSAYTVHADTGAVGTYALPVAIHGLAVFGGVLYIAATDGLYALDANTDLGEPIAWTLRTGLMDFGSPYFKRIRDLNLLARADGDSLARVIVMREGQKQSHDYHLPQLTREAPRDGVTKVGRGLTSVYWAVEWVGAGFVEIDSIVPRIEVLSRRR